MNLIDEKKIQIEKVGIGKILEESFVDAEEIDCVINAIKGENYLLGIKDNHVQIVLHKDAEGRDSLKVFDFL